MHNNYKGIQFSLSPTLHLKYPVVFIALLLLLLLVRCSLCNYFL